MNVDPRRRQLVVNLMLARFAQETFLAYVNFLQHSVGAQTVSIRPSQRRPPRPRPSLSRLSTRFSSTPRVMLKMMIAWFLGKIMNMRCVCDDLCEKPISGVWMRLCTGYLRQTYRRGCAAARLHRWIILDRKLVWPGQFPYHQLTRKQIDDRLWCLVQIRATI